ncbi:unnamed protein product, partial [Ectocarpus sp. 12 AP-2014]
AEADVDGGGKSAGGGAVKGGGPEHAGRGVMIAGRLPGISLDRLSPSEASPPTASIVSGFPSSGRIIPPSAAAAAAAAAAAMAAATNGA